jgi:hypothetical protein
MKRVIGWISRARCRVRVDLPNENKSEISGVRLLTPIIRNDQVIGSSVTRAAAGDEVSCQYKESLDQGAKTFFRFLQACTQITWPDHRVSPEDPA